MSWQNAPTLTRITASQQGGSRGAQFWGVQYDGKLNTIYQGTPGGGWSQWMGPTWNAHQGGPKQTYELAAAQQKDGRVQFFALDTMMQLWSTWQTSPGGDWSEWSGPNWNNSTTHGLRRVAACQMGGGELQVFGITEGYELVTTYQSTPGGEWRVWESWGMNEQQSQWIELTAAQQNNNRTFLWTLDLNQQLWAIENSPGGWGGWLGPNWDGAPPLTNIAASQQGGTRGAQLWGVREDGALVTTYQETPGGNWSGWSKESFFDIEPVYELTAAQQNNGCVQLWAVTTKQVLKSISQTSPGGNWGGWS